MTWTEKEIQAVWDKGEVVPTYRPDKWRKDVCGAWISRDLYLAETDFGWEIDHIVPPDAGGTNDLSNLRPVQWKNVRSKKDGRLACPVTAFAGGNIDRS